MQTMKEKQKLILKTHDYSLFEQDDTNRDFRENKLLKRSMIANGFLPEHPIIVVPGESTKFRIKDGGHRLSYAKELGLPVYYVVSDNSSFDIVGTNRCQRGWSKKDFVSSFCKQGNEHYIHLSAFAKTHGIDLYSAGTILGGLGANKIVLGTFEVTSVAHANAVMSVCDVIARHVKWGKSARTISAIHLVLTHSKADISVLKQKLDTYSSQLEQPVNSESAIAMIERIYNYRNQNMVPIAIQIKQSVRECQAQNAAVLHKHKTGKQ